MQTFFYQAPFGLLKLDFQAQILSGVDFCFEPKQHSQMLPAMAIPYFDALNAYFAGNLKAFTLPLLLQGTSFQQAVWGRIAAIAYGETCSYQDIALALENHPRAVGQACGRNPVPIFVPCHRVLGKNGLGGFILGRAEQALNIKRWLLQHEGVKL